MDIDYNAVAYAGAAVLDLVEDADKRKEYDALLLKVAPFVENAMRKEIEELVDDINSAVGAHYAVRLVHEDTADFVEVKPTTPEAEE